MVSENHPDSTTGAGDAAASIDRARYWFEQYRYASDWEARLIHAIHEICAPYHTADEGPRAEGSV